MKRICRWCIVIGLAISEPCLHMMGIPHIENAAGMVMPFLDLED